MTGTEASAFGPEFQALADTPMPWPQRKGYASMYLARLRLAPAEERDAVFASAEIEISPDIDEWDGFLRAVRTRFRDVTIPARWDDWDLRDATARRRTGARE